MHIQSAHIKNIRNITDFTWSLHEDELAGWHVLIGDNGSGKSTVLRSIALSLVGPKHFAGLRQNAQSWLTTNTAQGSITLYLQPHAIDDYAGRGKTGNKPLSAGIAFKKGSNEVDEKKITATLSPDRHIWGGGRGWFSAAYGPFRRFYGASQDAIRLMLNNPKIAAHLSVFDEAVALSESIEWLQRLNYQVLEKRPEGEILHKIRRFINQEDFLPHRAQLKSISSDGVFFEDANGHEITVDEMSDGYRSILSMTFDIIRQLQSTYQTDDIFNDELTEVKLPGVILIDEIDAHLHPTWQKRVGHWFRKHFPHMQFIVTTHSPLVCQASEVGSIWKLPRPGSHEKCERVSGNELERLLYGDILEAYSTQLFELHETRSDKGNALLHELAELNIKEMFTGLSDVERQRQTALRAILPTSANAIPEAET